MANKDKDFLCPDCFCQVMQSLDNDFQIVFYCRHCGLGPLVICAGCLNLITLEDALYNYCPYCEENLIIYGNQIVLSAAEFN